jgi:hypothetical protein
MNDTSELIYAMWAGDIQERRNSLKTTLLKRENGTWPQVEISRMVHNLTTEVASHPQFSEYLIIFGHFTKEEVLKAIWGGLAFTATKMTGLTNLPFNPGLHLLKGNHHD